MGCPDVWLTVISPAQLHIHLLLSSAAGSPAIVMLEAPGDQTPTMTGIQGIGVCTPSAAAVAVITIGFVVELHMPKVAMLTIGTHIEIVAVGIMLAEPGVGGPRRTVCPGGRAWEHLSMPPRVRTAVMSRSPKFGTSRLYRHIRRAISPYDGETIGRITRYLLRRCETL
jgi:hypothetical protein